MTGAAFGMRRETSIWQATRAISPLRRAGGLRYCRSVSEEAPKVVQIGDRLDKYLLVEKLGEGGMGVVFGGVHEGLGRQVAVKLLRAQFAQKEEFLARFQREAESVSRIGHPNIVAVYDFGRTADGSLYY